MTDTEKRRGTIERIRALMAKTVANGCTEAEAKLAAEAVDRLLLDYEIDLTEVTVREQKIGTMKVPGGNHDVQHAALSIGRFCDCKVWIHHGTQLAYLGFRVDVEIAAYLTALFMRAIDRERTQFQLFNPDWATARAAERGHMAAAFGVGMAERLGERLGELKSKRDFTVKSKGTDLVAIKMPLIEDAFASLGLNLGRGRRGPAIRDGAAYQSGRSAGDRVALNQGIQGRGQVGGRLK